MKNEEAMARARENETRIQAKRHQSHLQKHQTQLELERRLADERDMKSQERLQMSMERQCHIKRTYNQAEQRLDEKIQSTLGTIERKRQLEQSQKKQKDQLMKHQSMELLQKH